MLKIKFNHNGKQLKCDVWVNFVTLGSERLSADKDCAGGALKTRKKQKETATKTRQYSYDVWGDQMIDVKQFYIFTKYMRGFRSGVADSVLLVYEAASLSSRILMFRG